MKNFSWMRWMALGAVVAGGCAADDPSEGRGSQDGTYRYVLGVDENTGITYYGGSHEVVTVVERGKEEAIDLPNTPSRLHPALGGPEYMKYDPALTGGESEWDVFASNWWPQSSNGIANRWDTNNKDLNDHSDVDDLSPVEKYDLMFNPGQTVEVPEVEHHNYADLNRPEGERGEKHKHEAVTVAGPATAWELRNHGNYQSWVHPDSWWGHCNGWASYATAEPLGFPPRDVRVKLVDGEITECLEDSEGCILFKMGDIEALFSEVYFSDQATFSGRRCNTDPDEMERDEYGRPTEAACRDLNPGSFHVAVTGLLSRGAKHLGTNEDGKFGFIIDSSADWEVWNFPLHRFEIAEQEEIARDRAAELVGAEDGEYRWNDDAEKFVRVKLHFWMISDAVPWNQMKLPADQRSISQKQETMHYVLELDANDKILGGEWIQDPSFTWGPDSKEMHPDFMWAAVSAIGAGESADDTGGSNDNPYISLNHVRAIAECAKDASTCAPEGQEPDPEPEPGEDSCVDACGGDAGNCWCDDMCTEYNDCCADYGDVCLAEPEEPEPTPNSCAGHCGESGAVPDSDPKCYCDSVCSQYGDCCSDYSSVCTE